MIKSTPTVFVYNTSALGDMVCSLPVLKYAIDNFYKDKYKVMIQPYFKELFYFIPEENFVDITEDFKIPGYILMYFNEIDQLLQGIKAVRISPLRMTLGQYSSIRMLGRVLKLEEYLYLKFPVDNINLNKYGDIDYSKSVIITPNFNFLNRKLPEEEINKISDYIISEGYNIIFLGKSDISYKGKSVTFKVSNIDYSKGINLMDKTSISEAAAIISKCKAIIGVDNGLIHLAGMTDTPIIAGYTTQAPWHRIPLREPIFKESNNPLSSPINEIYIVEPDIPCSYCASNTQLNGWNFNCCVEGNNQCSKEMKAEKFIKYLEKILHV
jgi:ADP-heptose:LPS heptosyltransferase